MNSMDQIIETSLQGSIAAKEEFYRAEGEKIPTLVNWIVEALQKKRKVLIFGNGERQLAEIAHRIAAREPLETINDVRGTAFVRDVIPADWIEIDSTHLDTPGPVEAHIDPYQMPGDMPGDLHGDRRGADLQHSGCGAGSPALVADARPQPPYLRDRGGHQVADERTHA